jgi:hypothetical protein
MPPVYLDLLVVDRSSIKLAHAYREHHNPNVIPQMRFHCFVSQLNIEQTSERVDRMSKMETFHPLGQFLADAGWYMGH